MGPDSSESAAQNTRFQPFGTLGLSDCWQLATPLGNHRPDFFGAAQFELAQGAARAGLLSHSAHRRWCSIDQGPDPPICRSAGAAALPLTSHLDWTAFPFSRRPGFFQQTLRSRLKPTGRVVPLESLRQTRPDQILRRCGGLAQQRNQMGEALLGGGVEVALGQSAVILAISASRACS